MRKAVSQSELAECGISHEEFVEAVRSLDTFIDVSEEDLLKLHQLISNSQAVRRH